MIAGNLQKLIGEAMKAHDELRLSTLRLLYSAFNYEKIEKQHDLTDEEETAVIRKEAKKRKDAIEAYKKVGADDRAQKEEAELAILQEFLPPDMNEEDLEKIIEESISTLRATTIADMGKVIGMVKSKAPEADGSRIAQMVRSKLNG